MKKQLRKITSALLLSIAVLSSEAAQPAGPPPDLTKEPKAAEGRGDWNLGPTGMRGWMFVKDNYTDGARQILVTKIEKGSPADGTMEVGDVILGVAGQLFTEDARRLFGRAIDGAEKDGALALMVWRKGELKDVVVKLKVMGSYADMAPYDCAKSRKILEEGCKRIVENKDYGRCLVGYIALLASGDPQYAELLKAKAHEVAPQNPKFPIDKWVPGNPGGWITGYTCVFLSEYYLATGDKYVLPSIQ